MATMGGGGVLHHKKLNLHLLHSTTIIWCTHCSKRSLWNPQLQVNWTGHNWGQVSCSAK